MNLHLLLWLFPRESHRSLDLCNSLETPARADCRLWPFCKSRTCISQLCTSRSPSLFINNLAALILDLEFLKDVVPQHSFKTSFPHTYFPVFSLFPPILSHPFSVLFCLSPLSLIALVTAVPIIVWEIFLGLKLKILVKIVRGKCSLISGHKWRHSLGSYSSTSKQHKRHNLDFECSYRTVWSKGLKSQYLIRIVSLSITNCHWSKDRGNFPLCSSGWG